MMLFDMDENDLPVYSNFDETGRLLCKHCTDTYLHQFKVEVIDRSEDADNGRRVVIDSEVKIDTSIKNCPSNRRGGMNIYFYCENCEYITVMSISQHKGETFVKFTELLDTTNQNGCHPNKYEGE